MKILGFDIETFPHETWTWGLFDQNIGLNQLKNPGCVASWSAKFFGEDTIHFDSVHRSDPVTMHQGLHDLLSEADVVVTYNGNRFDIPWVQAGFVTYGMAPPRPFKKIDLLHVVKRNFKFASYKMEFVVKALGVGEKMANEGFDLWKRCMAGDEEAWKRMEEYNIHDTVLLEGLYNRVLPYIHNHPNRSVVEGLVCTNCGSSHYQSRGKYRTQAGLYNQYQCQDCGKWFFGNKNLAPTEKFKPTP